MARLHIEHILPIARGGTDEESNLWLACPICNGHKSDKVVAADPESGDIVPLFNARNHRWAEHFRWAENGLIITGTTAIGRATVIALRLNDDPEAMVFRSYWVQVGWYPPTD
jgi:hypothetical protein